MAPGDSDGSDGQADTSTTVTVRLTDSMQRGHPILTALAEAQGCLTFPSLPAAHRYTARLNQHTDGYSYYLTPDHHQETTTFYLRCQES